MYRVAIIEDDAVQARELAQMLGLSPYAESLVLWDEADAFSADPAAFAQALAERRIPDILLVDIHLGIDEGTGIDLVASIERCNRDVQVIYVSSYLEYVSDVYRTRHAWFLPKPVSQEGLDDALARAVAQLEEVRRRALVMRAEGALVRMDPGAIRYVESDRRKVRIHGEGRVIETYAKIGELEHMLPEDFARCHKSYLVNMAFIAEVGARDLVLENGERLPVSQRCRRALNERFLSYVGRCL